MALVAQAGPKHHTLAVTRRKQDIPLADIKLPGGAEPEARGCEHPYCDDVGEFRAPKSSQDLNSYYWFCLEHVRAYNATWNYFAGMTEQEIERFRREAVTGHRPTWRMGSGFRFDGENDHKDPFGLLSGRGIFAGAGDNGSEPWVDPKRRGALAVMNLETTASLQDIKMRYKQLVKRYHPDANGGDKAAEERFKSINEAYSFLRSNGAF